MPTSIDGSNQNCRYYCQDRNISGQCDNPHCQWNRPCTTGSGFKPCERLRVLGDISVADNIYIVCGQQTCVNRLMVSAALSGTSFPWIRISHHCSFSVVNGVTGSRSCSMNQMDMCSFTRGRVSHRDDIVGHGKVQKLRQLPGGSWTGC